MAKVREPFAALAGSLVIRMPDNDSSHPLSELSPTPAGELTSAKKRIAILIVAYNAAGTLRWVLDRIPDEVWEKVEEVFVFDDSSRDDTFLVGLGYKQQFARGKLSVFRNEKNLGYGGNQIRGYEYAIQQGYDIVALLHGDGQYAPEVLPELLAPLERGEADAVFGSRMLQPGEARKGGMPLYKYVGNRVLTTFENAALGMNLSEFHSGYRLYSVAALKRLPFAQNTHEFHFDTQIIIQMHAAGMKIVEIPIPTYYGEEICHVNGMRYAKDVFRSVLEYRAHEFGIAHRPEYELPPNYAMKTSELSSHSQLLDLVGPPSRRVLDLGCGQGLLSKALSQAGHRVTAVDFESPSVELDEFVQADISQGIPTPIERKFDTIILADVLEHLPDPIRILKQAKERLGEGGQVLVSLPNAVHWSVRAQILAGRFEYSNRGILDRGHLRFFTKASAERMFAETGLVARVHHTTPIPWENVFPKSMSVLRRVVEQIDFTLTKVGPNLFAYQHVFELRAKMPKASEARPG